MRHLKKTLAAVACLAIAGCADNKPDPDVPPSKGEQLSARQFYSEAKGKYICYTYDPQSDSCSIVSRVTGIKGDAVTQTGRAATVADGQILEFSLIGTSRIEGDRDCISGKDVKIGQSSFGPDIEAALLEYVRSDIDSYGGLCGTYFRDGESYIASSVGRDGRKDPDGDDRIHLFDSPKAIRPE